MTAKLTLRIVSPTDADGYLTAAQDFWRGLRDLTGVKSGAIHSSGLLAAQATECVLKSYLSLKGVPTKTLQKIGHDLERLWNDAREHGFPPENPPPHWLRSLSAGHGRPNFFFRYPLGLNGIAIPSQKSLTIVIENLISHVYAVKCEVK